MRVGGPLRGSHISCHKRLQQNRWPQMGKLNTACKPLPPDGFCLVLVLPGRTRVWHKKDGIKARYQFWGPPWHRKRTPLSSPATEFCCEWRKDSPISLHGKRLPNRPVVALSSRVESLRSCSYWAFGAISGHHSYQHQNGA